MIDEAEPPSFVVVVGDGYMELACRAIAASRRGQGPCVLLVDANLGLKLLFPDHPEYASKIVDPGFACTVSATADHARVAARLRIAHQYLVASVQ